MNPFLTTDGYKTGHYWMYPQGTSLVYSNWTPRHGKHSNVKESKGVVVFGTQMVMKKIHEMFDEYFFKIEEKELNSLHEIEPNDAKEWDEELKRKVCQEIKKEYSMYLGTDYDVSHIEALWDLGYLPIEVKALPEGSFCPYGVPALTIKNSLPEFFWLTNFLETLISNLLWLPMTSATSALDYKRTLMNAARKTDKENIAFVEFQGHDFSMRGMGGLDATMLSGLGHAAVFKGSDSLPVIVGARKYYNEKDFVVGSVNATEHSVMCAGKTGTVTFTDLDGTEITEDFELETFRYLMKQFPTGILSIVSDTWDLWKVITEYLVILKDEILTREGKIVIRPDSGDPVDIICGRGVTEELFDAFDADLLVKVEGGYREVYNSSHYLDGCEITLDGDKLWSENEKRGVVELLWDIFGGTINKQGYKVLDPHIGCIYGDSITPQRAKEICARLEAKGFASTNVILGIGSYTYQYVTRDTHGFAMKATYCEVNGEGREIFKDPITGDGSKKSAKGLLKVIERDGTYVLKDQVSWEEEKEGELVTIYKNGNFKKEVTLTEIRERLNNLL